MKRKTTKDGLPILTTEQVTNLLNITFNNGLDKGVLLLGPTGIGKTTIFNKFLINKGIYKTTMEDLVIKYNERGVKIFSSPSTELPNYNEYQKVYYAITGQTPLYIDDIGAEQNETFGKTPLLRDTVLKIYDKKQKFYGTTNLNKEKFIELYGEKIWKRMEEMCYIVFLDAPNWREENAKADLDSIYDSLDISTKAVEVAADIMESQLKSSILIKKEERKQAEQRPLTKHEIEMNKEYEQFKYKRALENENELVQTMINICNHEDFPDYLKEKMENENEYNLWLDKMSGGQREVFDNWLSQR